MARRSEDWNIDLAKRLRNRAFARAFLLAAIDEGLTVQQALAKVIRAIGITKFAAQSECRDRTCSAQSIRGITQPRKR